MSISIALAAGGTGGHLLPALAVGDALRRIEPDARILIVGSTRHLDETLATRSGFATATTEVVSFSSIRALPHVSAQLRRAVSQAGEHLDEHDVQAVLGFGGYPSLPPILAARRRGLPRAVHEANALPRLGLANRLGARTGARVFGGFGSTGASLRGAVTRVGVPLREEIFEPVTPERRRDARARWGIADGQIAVFVIGGSLGASRLNDAIIGLASGLPPEIVVHLSAGTAEHERVAQAVAADANVTVHPFIEDMASAYTASDVVVARSGASTVAELETVGVPCVLIPLPIARAGEQDANAAVLAATGQATVLADAAVTPEALFAAVQGRRGIARFKGTDAHRGSAHQLALALLESARGSS